MQTEQKQWVNIKQMAYILAKEFPSTKWYPQKLERHIKTNIQPPPYMDFGHKAFNPDEVIEWAKKIFDARKLGNRRKKHG